MHGEKGEEKFYALLAHHHRLDHRAWHFPMTFSTCGSGSKAWQSALTSWWLSTMNNPLHLKPVSNTWSNQRLVLRWCLFGIAILFSVTGTTSFEYIWHLDTSGWRIYRHCGGVLLDRRFWRQSSTGSTAHLAAGCPFTGPFRYQRHAFGYCHRSRSDRHAAQSQPAGQDRR